jgi:hypothetical protein
LESFPCFSAKMQIRFIQSKKRESSKKIWKFSDKILHNSLPSPSKQVFHQNSNSSTQGERNAITVCTLNTVKGNLV